jgi:hypothetical protein
MLYLYTSPPYLWGMSQDPPCMSKTVNNSMPHKYCFFLCVQTYDLFFLWYWGFELRALLLLGRYSTI